LKKKAVGGGGDYCLQGPEGFGPWITRDGAWMPFVCRTAKAKPKPGGGDNALCRAVNQGARCGRGWPPPKKGLLGFGGTIRDHDFRY